MLGVQELAQNTMTTVGCQESNPASLRELESPHQQVTGLLRLTPTVRLMNDIASSKMPLEVLSISSMVSLIRSLHTNVNSTPVLVIENTKKD